MKTGQLIAACRQNRCFYLLLGLVGLLTVHPFFYGSAFVARTTLTAFTLVVLMGAMIAIRAGGPALWGAMLLGLPTFITIAVDVVVDSPPLTIIASVFGVLFFSYVTIAVLRYVVGAGRVTADKLFGAACVYLLLGVSWTMIYALAIAIEPESFRLTDSLPFAEPTWPDLLYYSFATQTTLGYGDITPVTPALRSLAVLQAVTGVLYTALLVARLVALYTAERTD